MPVSFLDLTPRAPTATVMVNTIDQGEQPVELTGISLRDLGDISKRFPAFARVLEGGAGNIMESPEALGALIAAALGRPGDAACEAHIARFPTADVMNLALAAIRLTFPQSLAAPLSPGAANGAAGAAAPDPTSPLQLSS
jgi:hypothetical protein